MILLLNGAMAPRLTSMRRKIGLSCLIGICVLLLLPRASASGQASSSAVPRGTADGTVIRGIELLYDLRFDEAESLFLKVVDRKPKDPVGYFYLAMVTWSRLSTGFWGPHEVKEYGERIARVIDVAKGKIAERRADSYTYFYLGGALGFKARFELMQHNWLSSFNHAYEAIEALKTCQKMDPENRDVLLGLGIFDYYTARLSGILKFLTYLLLHKGNKEEGIRELRLAADEGTFSAIEAKSVLLHIYLFLEQDYGKALPLSKALSARFTNNSRYNFFVGVVYIRTGDVSRYREVLNALRARSRAERSASQAGIWGNQALYLQASDHLFRGEYDQARSTLKEILSRADPVADPGMTVWPLLKIGMSYDLEGDREKALGYYRRILALENGAGAQFLAERYVDAPPQEGDPFLGY